VFPSTEGKPISGDWLLQSRVLSYLSSDAPSPRNPSHSPPQLRVGYDRRRRGGEWGQRRLGHVRLRFRSIRISSSIPRAAPPTGSSHDALAKHRVALQLGRNPKKVATQWALNGLIRLS